MSLLNTLLLSLCADAVDYNLAVSVTDGKITAVEPDGWTWEAADANCAEYEAQADCEDAGCRWNDDYDVMCNADTIFATKLVGDNGYFIEVIDAQKTFCESWLNAPAINLWNQGGRGVLYLLSLFYLFLGVAICADIFMSAIEVITSKTYTINALDEDGHIVNVEAHVWNETVANLTLLALGSSAPEILLALMETIKGLGEPAGELGPATIVGSASFNLFIIIAVCVISVPAVGTTKDESGIRKVTELGVFLITSVSSLWAYIWLLICIEISSPQEVTPVEATFTFLMFPALVGIAFGQDTGWTCCNRMKSKRNVERVKFKAAARGNVSVEDAVEELKVKTPIKKSYMVFRANAIREVSGKKSVFKKPEFEPDEAIELQSTVSKIPDKLKARNEPMTTIEFVCGKYAVKEDDGSVSVSVRRIGNLNATHQVVFETSDGDAQGKGDQKDYEHTEGVLTFAPGEKLKSIDITIYEDDLVEENEKFYVFLSHPKCTDKSHTTVGLGKLKVCEITIIDVSFPGEVGFVKSQMTVQEDCGTITIPLERIKGSMGEFIVEYTTSQITAWPDDHFYSKAGSIKFEPNETHKDITIDIINKKETKDEDRTFEVLLTKAINFNNTASLTNKTVVLVCITDSEKYAKMMKRIMHLWDAHKSSGSLASSSWRALFEDAAGAPAQVSCMGYLVHTLALPWKLLLAIIPPTSYFGGWLTFWCSLATTGAITFVIGEMAETFACMVGIPKAFAAVTFVALGTSMPDTFASRTATQMSPDADAAICNVTGSNSVNVFLGLGLPWVVASYYAAAKSETYVTPAGDLRMALIAFIPCAIICFITLLIRRQCLGGELGGPTVPKWLTFFFFIGLWAFFIVMAAV